MYDTPKVAVHMCVIGIFSSATHKATIFITNRKWV